MNDPNPFSTAQSSSTGQTTTSTSAATGTSSSDDSFASGIILIDGKEILVDPDIRTKHADLLEMIKLTKSMNLDEKEYWIQLLPVMNDTQVKNLRDILTREKQKLQAIDAKYSSKMSEISQKYINKWDTSKNQHEKNKRQSEESVHSEADDAKADDLLSAL